jgi:hypothetical protein
MSKRSRTVTRKFFEKLLPNEDFDSTKHPAKPLVAAAFCLYEQTWRLVNPLYDINEWRYPFLILQSNSRFSGDEPWIVLLERAAELAREAVYV